MFNKIGYLLNWLKTKIKYLLFGFENKNFSQNFVFALEKLVFCCLDPDPEFGIQIRNPGSGIRIGEKVLDPDP